MPKIGIILPASVVGQIDDLAEGLRLNRTQAVRDAIHTRHKLMREIQDGTTIILERRNGERVHLLLTESTEADFGPPTEHDVPAPDVSDG